MKLLRGHDDEWNTHPLLTSESKNAPTQILQRGQKHLNPHTSNYKDLVSVFARAEYSPVFMAATF